MGAKFDEMTTDGVDFTADVTVIKAGVQQPTQSPVVLSAHAGGWTLVDRPVPTIGTLGQLTGKVAKAPAWVSGSASYHNLGFGALTVDDTGPLVDEQWTEHLDFSFFAQGFLETASPPHALIDPDATGPEQPVLGTWAEDPTKPDTFDITADAFRITVTLRSAQPRPN